MRRNTARYRSLDERVQRALVPDPTYSWEGHQRFYGLDLPHLSDAALWAERVHLTSVLASRIQNEQRDRLTFGALTSENTWLRERIRGIRCEEQQRRRHAR